MTTKHFISVILPVRLQWEPCYVCDGDISVGDRVSVAFGKSVHTGVVSAVDIRPSAGGRTVQGIMGKTDLPPVSLKEMELWRFISSYYLCSIGEVYKAAYPGGLVKAEGKKSRKKMESGISQTRRTPMSGSLKEAAGKVLDFFDENRSVLLRCDEGRWKIYEELIRRTLERGMDVLFLTPNETEPVMSCALVYNSRTSSSSRREIAGILRSSAEGHLIQGSRIAVFLPFRKLGLVIVDEEQSRDYKQESPAPRYNGRDTALALAKIHGANAVVGSPVPSLESWYNAVTGRFSLVEVPDSSYYRAEIIDMKAEKRKNGIPGEYFSRVLLSKMEQCLGNGERVLILLPWADTSDAEIEARRNFPKAGTKLVFKPLRKVSENELGKYSLVALLRAEYMLSRQDIRADETALQSIARLCGKCSSLVIQTARAEHPVFTQDPGLLTAMLEERKAFGAPPFTRDVAVYLPAGNDYEGLTKMIHGRRFSETHHFLPKDRTLAEKKELIASTIPAGAIIDVDPL